ncbi:MAG TPA: plastocyanin/azurin family copper-binding protein [Solirubrobacteraceae bacterium]|nr:plastocyanin/azurin family copper-binding protein [Solirubrobacteraceae bacterium]
MSSRHLGTSRPSVPKLLIPALAVGALALAGCGSSSTSSTSTSPPSSTSAATTNSSTTAPASGEGQGASATLAVAANPEGQLKFDKSALSAKAGKVTIDFTNMSSLGHNMTVESAAGKVEGSTPTFQGSSKSVTLNLKPGTYKFFCSVPGHRQAGMEGTLTVQ